MRALLAAGANVATGQPIEGHPFVIKLLAHGVIDAQDLKALGRVLNRKVTVKKRQDIIVQGYEYNTLDFVESGFAFRYTLLRKGGRQIINQYCQEILSDFLRASLSARSFRSRLQRQ